MEMETTKNTSKVDIFIDKRNSDRRQKIAIVKLSENNRRNAPDRRGAYKCMERKPWWLKRDYVDYEEVIIKVINNLPRPSN